MAIELGSTVHHKFTDFSGRAMCRSQFIHGCSHISVQPNELRDGVPVDWVTLDEQHLVEYDGKPVPRHELLGKKVRDSLTSVVGIVVNYTEYPDSGSRVAIQQQGVFHEGNPVKAIGVDVAAIEVLTSDKPKVEQAVESDRPKADAPRKPAGPKPDVTRRALPERR